MESHALLCPINKYKITPTFAHSYESFCLSIAHWVGINIPLSPVAMDKIQNTLAIAAPGNDTIETGTQLFNTETL